MEIITDLLQADLSDGLVELAGMRSRFDIMAARVVGDVELHNPLADRLQAGGLRLYHHPLGYWRGAGCRRAATALDLDQADAAGAERIQHVGCAELRNLDAAIHRGAHDGSAFGHSDLMAVDGEGNLLRRFRSWSAVVDFVDEAHDEAPLVKGKA